MTGLEDVFDLTEGKFVIDLTWTRPLYSLDLRFELRVTHNITLVDPINGHSTPKHCFSFCRIQNFILCAVMHASAAYIFVNGRS